MQVNELCSKGYASNLLEIVGNDNDYSMILQLLNYIIYIQGKDGNVPEIIEFSSKGRKNPLTESEIESLTEWLEEKGYIEETKRAKYKLKKKMKKVFECLIFKNYLYAQKHKI